MNTQDKKRAQVDQALLSLMHIGAMLMQAHDRFESMGHQTPQMLEADAEGLAIAIEILKNMQGPRLKPVS